MSLQLHFCTMNKGGASIWFENWWCHGSWCENWECRDPTNSADRGAWNMVEGIIPENFISLNANLFFRKVATFGTCFHLVFLYIIG